MFILRLLVAMGQFRSLISLRRGSPWVLASSAWCAHASELHPRAFPFPMDSLPGAVAQPSGEGPGDKCCLKKRDTEDSLSDSWEASCSAFSFEFACFSALFDWLSCSRKRKKKMFRNKCFFSHLNEYIYFICFPNLKASLIWKLLGYILEQKVSQLIVFFIS